MNVFNLMLWSMAVFCLSAFWWYYAWPHIQRKWLYWRSRRLMLKLAKKYPKDRDKFLEAARLLKEISDAEKLLEEDDIYNS